MPPRWRTRVVRPRTPYATRSAQGLRSTRDCQPTSLTGDFQSGGTAVVRLDCQVHYKDLGLLGIPGSIAGQRRGARPDRHLPEHPMNGPGSDKLNHRWLSWSKPRNEQGSATVFVIGFAIVLFLCAGLVIDGGLAINKRMRIADDAEQAARIGADSINVAEFRRTETLVIDQPLARQRMTQYMSSLGYGADNWQPDIGADRVGVTLTDSSKTYILDLFGVEFPVRASAVAVPDTGPNAGQNNNGQPAPAP